jgi:hypothetical protein
MRERRKRGLPAESGAPILWTLVALVGWLLVAAIVAGVWWLA